MARSNGRAAAWPNLTASRWIPASACATPVAHRAAACSRATAGLAAASASRTAHTRCARRQLAGLGRQPGQLRTDGGLGHRQRSRPGDLPAGREHRHRLGQLPLGLQHEGAGQYGLVEHEARSAGGDGGVEAAQIRPGAVQLAAMGRDQRPQSERLGPHVRAGVVDPQRRVQVDYGFVPAPGFRGQTLWDWFELLLLPAALTITMALTSVRLRPSYVRWLRRYQTPVMAALTAGWVVTVIGGYALGWRWTGYQGNTLWDWLGLLLLPLVFPTILLPALLTWISGDAAGRASQAKEAAVARPATAAGRT